MLGPSIFNKQHAAKMLEAVKRKIQNAKATKGKK